MISFIITTYKEPDTIGNAIKYLVDPEYSGINLGDNFELLVAAPDKETISAAEIEVDKLAKKRLINKKIQYKLINDPGKGKILALKECIKSAKGEWLILTDGDVCLENNAVSELIKLKETKNKDNKLGGISGRPVSIDKKDSMLKYWGNLLSDAAHHKRQIDLTENPVGLSTKIVPKRSFFPLSGYLMMIRNLNNKGMIIPDDCLVEDAYISYVLFNEGYHLEYSPEARVGVKFPQNLKDYFAQKKRSTGGYVQLWKYGVVNKDTKSRSFWRELEYFWFPIKYAQNFRELLWSLMLYPTRAWLWLKIWWERKIVKKDFANTWVRIESTK